jgi:glycosyltransferase involved in cell wall biosynthesis
MFVELAAGLDGRGWRSVAAVGGSGWVYHSLCEKGIEPDILHSRTSFDVRYVWNLVKLVKARDINLIQSHLLGSSVYGSMVGALSGVPVVSTFHGQWDMIGNDRYRSLRARIINRGSRKVVFVSESLRRAILSSTRLDADRTTVIPNGIDHRMFTPGSDGSLRGELGLREADFLVGAVGNVRPAKAYDTLLNAATLLRKESPAYRFVIVGEAEGSLYDKVAALRDRLGLRDAMRFAGFRDDIPRLMKNLDVYVITSSSEGFSLSTLQAMASGRPVVATRCGGPEEFITDNVNGFLVDVNAPAQLARAVEQLRREPETRERVGRAAREFVKEKYSVDDMLKSYEDLYDQVALAS